MKTDVIVVGAGASGLVAAIAAARNQHKVLILEHKEKAGKKIYATGNGKCNLTNYMQTIDCYRSDDIKEVEKTLQLFGFHETIAFFEELGIYIKERNGYCYPNSEQAASVVSVLLLECKRLGVTISYEEHVEKIIPSKNGYKIETTKEHYEAGNVILSTGGCASKAHGSDGSGFDLAKQLGLTVIKPLPALVQLRSNFPYLKQISGVRMECVASLFIEEKRVCEENGEIIFTDYGISGIPIFQLSRFAAKALDAKKYVQIKLDLLPSLAYPRVEEMLQKRFEKRERTCEECMTGLFAQKLNQVLIKNAGVEPSQSIYELSGKKEKEFLKKLTSFIKAFTLTITSTNPFEQAQVCCGGVKLTQINPETMECHKYKGLYLTGELLDVDGTCGGYNLQWAWTSGYLAGNAI